MKKAHPALSFILAAILIVGLIAFLIAPLVGAAEMTLAQNTQINSTSYVNGGSSLSTYTPVTNSYNGYGYYGTIGADPYYAGYGQPSTANPFGYRYECNQLNRNLSQGMSGTDVYNLQVYLSTQGYLNAAATGYFGTLTQTAIMLYQRNNNLQQTGMFDSATRSRLVGQCLGTGGVNNGGNASDSQSRPRITSISPKTGSIGSTVTIKGKYFNRNNNYVLFNGHTVAVVSPSDGKTLTFVVPEYAQKYCEPNAMCIMLAYLLSPGTYDVTVRTTAGESTKTTFKLTESNSSQTSRKPHIDSYEADEIYYFNSANTNAAGFVAAPPAKSVTLKGVGFTGNNDIYANGYMLQGNVQASNGKGTELTFTVQGNTNNCTTYYCTDVYRPRFNNMSVYVKNAHGTSNEIYLDLNDETF